MGEVWVRGPNVMAGYYRNPEATAQVLGEDGWLRTGDLGRRGVDGHLFLVSRSKELIIRSGFNVYPPEVECVLNDHPTVLHSAVVGRRVGTDEEVVAFVQRKSGCSVSEAELGTFAAERLAPYKVPTTIVVMKALPAGPTGKILKKRLAEMAEEMRQENR